MAGASLRALIWDVDGTVAETERDGHLVAFNQAFQALDLAWFWDEAMYGQLLHVTGGRERLMHFMQGRADAPATPAARAALAAELHARKNVFYAERVAAGGIQARPGVLALMHECRANGVALAVATTTSASNVQALFNSLLGSHWRDHFAAVLCAEDAPLKKPDPQVYRLALQQLQMQPGEAFALEDSPNGLSAALAAGLRCGITRSACFQHAAFDGAAWVVADLCSPQPMTLERLTTGLAQVAAARAA